MMFRAISIPITVENMMESDRRKRNSYHHVDAHSVQKTRWRDIFRSDSFMIFGIKDILFLCHKEE